MDDEGSDRPPSDDADDESEEPSEAVDEPASDGSDSDGSEEDGTDEPVDESEEPSEAVDDPEEDGDDPTDASDEPVEGGDDDRPLDAEDDPGAAADERVSDGPYGADAEEPSETDADAQGDTDADPETDTEPVSQSDLEPAGDPDKQWGPEDTEDWEDPFPDVEMETPEYDPDEDDESYPANPNVPEQSVEGDRQGEMPAAPPAEADGAAGEAPGASQTESDGGYADPTSTTTVEGYQDGPASDEEMPLADHIEEMVRRLGVVIVVLAVVSAVVFPFAERIINFLWFTYLPGQLAQCPANPDIAQGGAACARVYNPLALIFARLKMATLAGLVISLPVFVYETYLFMRPGLYPKERRYYLASVPTSLILAAAGVAFAHFLVLPAIFTYFVFYSEDATVIAFGLTETFDLMVLMLGGFAIIFQIPLFISLALMMGIVTRGWMASKRLYFWGAFAGLAFLFSPDPTGMAPIIVAATMIVLFEGTLLLAKWTGRK
ncbi:twin-arginine translocase subunit TatC [Haloglomus litoreum]|uniref:twin-arginine translocase subunit TatC n=1 Tax=Haloglomus litoreum TaxID=3034026 RepID=UPI0023E76C9F|nr:twin-arginine translocase subunit TatC [Haloglomus sp. DT116]